MSDWKPSRQWAADLGVHPHTVRRHYEAGRMVRRPVEVGQGYEYAWARETRFVGPEDGWVQEDGLGATPVTASRRPLDRTGGAARCLLPDGSASVYLYRPDDDPRDHRYVFVSGPDGEVVRVKTSGVFWTTTAPAEVKEFHDLVIESANAETRRHRKTYRVVSLFDVHVPEHDEKALAAVIAFLEDVGTDCLLIGGDFLELGSMSQHGGDPRPPAFREDIAKGRQILRRLREVIGEDTEMHYLGGNHESRHERKVIARLPELAGFNTIPDALGLLDIGCGWSPYKQMWRPEISDGVMGRLYYTHGAWATKHHACKHLDVYGVNVRFGHTHKPQTFTRGYADGAVRVGIGTGCLRTLDPDWIGPATGWVHGFGVDEFMADGTFTHHNVMMTRGRFSWGGKVYG